MSTVKPLSDAQKRILSNAAERPDRVILPLPADFRARGAVRQKVLEALLKQGLVAERTTTNDAAVWRRDARRRRLTLAMTAAGCAALGHHDETAAPMGRQAADTCSASGSHAAGSREHPTTASRSASSVATAGPSGKLGAILAAMAGEQGATLAALVDLTGWLPHTTRAALSRLRQRGYPIRLVGEAGRKAYCLDVHAEG